MAQHTIPKLGISVLFKKIYVNLVYGIFLTTQMSVHLQSYANRHTEVKREHPP